MKRMRELGLPALLAALAVGTLFYALETWQQHAENLLVPLLIAVLTGWSIIRCAKGLRARDRLQAAAFALAAGVCAWALVNCWRIPFCLECNGGVTAEELGWMAPWFFSAQ